MLVHLGTPIPPGVNVTRIGWDKEKGCYVASGPRHRLDNVSSKSLGTVPAKKVKTEAEVLAAIQPKKR